MEGGGGVCKWGCYVSVGGISGWWAIVTLSLLLFCMHAIGMHFLISVTTGLSKWYNRNIYCTGRMALCSNHTDWHVLSFIGMRMRQMKRERRMKYLS